MSSIPFLLSFRAFYNLQPLSFALSILALQYALSPTSGVLFILCTIFIFFCFNWVLFSRRSNPLGAGFWLRMRDRVPRQTGGGIPHRSIHRPGGPVPPEGPAPCHQVSLTFSIRYADLVVIGLYYAPYGHRFILCSRDLVVMGLYYALQTWCS
jgi:hypothetical protein